MSRLSRIGGRRAHWIAVPALAMWMALPLLLTLLLGLADPAAMTIRQIELTDRWLSQWARKVFPYAQQRETEGPVMLVDLDGSAGATLAAAAPGAPPRSMRFCYPGKLATSVRGRLKRLAAGTSPAELQLGHDLSVEGCTALLSHLDAHWYQLPRRSADTNPAALELATGGVPAAYFRVGGRTFDRQDPLGRLTFQGAQYLQTLGALTDYDRHREDAERNWPWERWQGAYEWREAVLTRNDGGDRDAHGLRGGDGQILSGHASPALPLKAQGGWRGRQRLRKGCVRMTQQDENCECGNKSQAIEFAHVALPGVRHENRSERDAARQRPRAAISLLA
jgi:hypothetical protein